MLSEYVKTTAGRWFDRYYQSPQEMAPALPSSLPEWEADPPHSTPRPASTLMRGEQVLVDGVWREVARPECLRTSQGPSQILLHLVGGGILGSRFDYTYVSRDVDEQVAARIGGAA